MEVPTAGGMLTGDLSYLSVGVFLAVSFPVSGPLLVRCFRFVCVAASHFDFPFLSIR